MQRHITVTLVSVTEVDDGLGNVTEDTTETTYNQVRFAPRAAVGRRRSGVSVESTDLDEAKIITGAALYRRGDLPAAPADRVIIADQHPTIDGTWEIEGEVGRWATGVEVAIKRTLP